MKTQIKFGKQALSFSGTKFLPILETFILLLTFCKALKTYLSHNYGHYDTWSVSSL